MTIFLNSNTAGGIKMLEGNQKRGGGLDVPRGGGAQDTPEFLAHCTLGVARYSGGDSGQGGPLTTFQSLVFLFHFDQIGLHCKVKRSNRDESLYIYVLSLSDSLVGGWVGLVRVLPYQNGADGV